MVAHEVSEPLDVMAIGAHPDDVELGCGGTLALMSGQGRRVGILHLTEGEAGTRGTVEQRRQEAGAAAAALGATALEFLDCGDGRLRTGEKEEDDLIAMIRKWRPQMILAPAPADRHPDHGRAFQLVEAACFYSGLAARGEGVPHRPAAMYSYMQHDPFEPRFIVDVSSVWDTKLSALAAYASQLHQPGVTAEGPPTKVASPEFRRAVEGRAQHFGLMISAAYGEPFWSRRPLAVTDPFDVIPGGLP